VSNSFHKSADFIKVDDSLGLVLGWAIVSSEDGVNPYFDLQDDHVTDEAIMQSTVDFMKHSRVAKEMHQGDAMGTILFAWPMTADVRKSLGLGVGKTGLLVGMKPESEEVLSKFKDGTYTGFSIGGRIVEKEEVDG